MLLKASASCSTMFLAKHASTYLVIKRCVAHCQSCLARSCSATLPASVVNVLLALPACCSQISHNWAKHSSALSSHCMTSSNSSIFAFIPHSFPMQLRQQSFQRGEGQAALPSGLPQTQQPSTSARATATQPTCTGTACQQWNAQKTVPGMCTDPGVLPGRACQS